MSITQTLGIELPLIQSPMAGVQDWRLAVAVSESGGLGSIPCGMLSPQQVNEALTEFTLHSGRPYNLNFFCHEMPPIDHAQEKLWSAQLSRFYDEFGLEGLAPESPLRMPFNAEMADVIESFNPPVVSFHFGLPSRALVKRIKSWGTLIMSSATTLEEGRWLESEGVDVVIAQGLEAGGHRGMFMSEDLSTQRTTHALVNALTDCLSVPVVAAGGLANADDIERMMSIGASGVQMGTVFLLCDEVASNDVYRAALHDLDARTDLTNIFSGRPARGIVNRAMRELGCMSELAPKFPYAATAIAPLRAHANACGLSDFLPMWSGTNRKGCKAVPAGDLVRSLFS